MAVGKLLVLAVLGAAVESAIDLAGQEHFAGKVVIDATNPLDFSGGTPPTLAWGTPTPAASTSSARCPMPGWSRRSTRSDFSIS